MLTLITDDWFNQREKQLADETTSLHIAKHMASMTDTMRRPAYASVMLKNDKGRVIFYCDNT